MRSGGFVAAVILGVVLFVGVYYALRTQVPPATVIASPVGAATASAAPPPTGARPTPMPSVPSASYVNPTYKFSVMLPAPYQVSAALTIDRVGTPPQVGFTARTPADEAAIPRAECHECPLYQYAAIVSVQASTGSQTPREWYDAHESAAGQQIDNTTVDGHAAIHVTNSVTFTVQLVIKDGDRILIVGYNTYPNMAVPGGATKDKLEAILASFTFVR